MQAQGSPTLPGACRGVRRSGCLLEPKGAAASPDACDHRERWRQGPTKPHAGGVAATARPQPLAFAHAAARSEKLRAMVRQVRRQAPLAHAWRALNAEGTPSRGTDAIRGSVQGQPLVHPTRRSTSVDHRSQQQGALP